MRPRLLSGLETFAVLAAACADADVCARLAPGDVEAGPPAFALAALADAPVETDDETQTTVDALLVAVECAPKIVVDAGRAIAQQLVAEREQCRTPLPPLGALQLWRHELAMGRRTVGTMDVLWRAAVKEITAAEWDAAGDRAGAVRLLDEATALLADAQRMTDGRAA